MQERGYGRSRDFLAPVRNGGRLFGLGTLRCVSPFAATVKEEAHLRPGLGLSEILPSQVLRLAIVSLPTLTTG